MLNTDLDAAHATGFELQDVKFTFIHDIKVRVTGLQIEAKAGEILTIPRYAASVLEAQKHGEIQEADMEVDLKQAIVKENVQGEFELATLDEHFYIKLKAYTKKLAESEREKLGSMLNGLLRKRHGKLVHLADSSRLTPELSSKMTVEEREFYAKMHELSSEFTSSIMGEKN